MNSVTRYLLLLCVLLPLPGFAVTCDKTPHLATDFVVEFNSKQNQLTIVARAQLLNAVLHRITVETGIEFIGGTGRCDDVDIEFNNIKLSQALAQVLVGRNYIVQAENGRQILRVWLLPAGNEDNMTEKEVLEDEFYRQLQGTSNVENLAERIRQLGSEQ